MGKLDTILEIVRVILIWISGYLFASGLLLSYPHNPIWWTPSFIIIVLLLLGDLVTQKILNNKEITRIEKVLYEAELYAIKKKDEEVP